MRAAAQAPLSGEELAARVAQLRGEIVRRSAARNRALGYDEIDDVYGQVIVALLEREPPATFATEWELRAWLSEAMRRSLLKHSRSSAVRLSAGASRLGAVCDDDAEEDVVEPASIDFTPEQHLLIAEEHDALIEYIAGLRVEDRVVALLWLWPSSRLTAKRIAGLLDMPLDDVRTAIHRVKMDFSRYSALSAANVCRKQMRHLDRWRQEGGELPLALTLHSRRCPTCRATVSAARERAYDALLPLTPAFLAPAAGGGGLVAKALSLLGHAGRTAPRLARRPVPTTKEGAGSALLATKSGTAAVITAATVVAGAGTVAAIHVHGSWRPHHHVRTAVAVPTATSTVADGATAPVTSPTVTSAPVGTTSTVALSTVTATTATTTSTSDAAPDSAAGGTDDRQPGTAVGSASADTDSGSGDDSDAPPWSGSNSFTSGASGSGGKTGLSPTGKTPSAP